MNLILTFLSLAISFSCFSQSGSEIFLFDMKIVNGEVHLSNGVNITNHKGYDNQPFFHPDQSILYFSSFDDSGRSDIKFYNYKTRQASNLTSTHEREYSPTVTPDKKFISCIIQRDNGVQDLAKYPIDGGKPQVLIDHLKIGYHAWAGEDRVFLYVLDDSIHNSLHYYMLGKNADTVIAENIGRSIHAIPWESKMSFVQKLEGKQGVIKAYDLFSGVISPVIYTLPGQDFFCWVANYPNKDQKKIMISSDGSKIYSYEQNPLAEFKDRKWQAVMIDGDASMLKGVTRLAANYNDGKLAVVVSE